MSYLEIIAASRWFVYTLKSPFKTTARMVFGGMIVDLLLLLLALLQVLVQVFEMAAIDCCLPVIPDVSLVLQLLSPSLQIPIALDRFCRSIVPYCMYPASCSIQPRQGTAGCLQLPCRANDWFYHHWQR